MKTYSIGRDLNCDIVINDSTDVISRRHALLNVTSSGKMTIIDQSSNGTYVNGIRITQNVPVPVTRKDIVSLAHVAKLDWGMVPKSNRWMMYAAGVVVVAVVVLGIVFGMRRVQPGAEIPGAGGGDSIAKVDSAAMKQKEAAHQDSIKEAARQDSIRKAAEKARQDSLREIRKKSRPKKEPKDSVKDKKQKDAPKDKDKKDAAPSKRAIG